MEYFMVLKSLQITLGHTWCRILSCALKSRDSELIVLIYANLFLKNGS